MAAAWEDGGSLLLAPARGRAARAEGGDSFNLKCPPSPMRAVPRSSRAVFVECLGVRCQKASGAKPFVDAAEWREAVVSWIM